MTSDSKRVQRVQRELFETLSKFLLHDLREPLPSYASITAVEVSPDLRNAKVFFRIVGADAAETEEILESRRSAFQKHLASTVKMKFCPVLKFEFGRVDQMDEVDLLLENLRRPKTFGD